MMDDARRREQVADKLTFETGITNRRGSPWCIYLLNSRESSTRSLLHVVVFEGREHCELEKYHHRLFTVWTRDYQWT